MPQTFTLPCHRAGHCANAGRYPSGAIRAGYVAVFAQALTCRSEDHLLIPVRD
ncbi:hypothetical protein OEG79_15490 [Pseudomonas sp. Z8(2022)]|jgi:hypothetical protein|uniref:hypothetical protein n=1 Tax=Pseudomonas sp. Z8(2022) TaxID=2962597 RepID=UPI0021F3DC51|nr:hypothetical protein [Pseudomonas sp. Z8(2022)]UYP29450.1 hypothetical protein OEG79_15490 [Pseudomonas sp. Z8(2022)]